MSHLCPRDQIALTVTSDVFGPGASAQVCPKCVGVLAEWNVAQKFFESIGLHLGDLKTAVAESRARPHASSPGLCTVCGKASLQPFLAKGVEVDLCPECGTSWFDRGELARVSGGKLGQALSKGPQALWGERVEEVGVFEMLWDCAYCDTRGLLGKSNRHCPKCGAIQEAAHRYFPPPGQEVQANSEYDGADRTCPSCGTPNGAKSVHCRQCGSPLDGSSEVGRVADRVDRPSVSAASPKVASASRPPWVWGVLALAVLGIGVCGASLLWTRDARATVSDHNWTREIDVEALAPILASSWCDAVPGDAYLVSRKHEQRSTKQVPDGDTCGTRDIDRGNGTFQRVKECKPKYRAEPVYEDKCYYTVDRWQHSRSEKATGRGLDAPPVWPRVSLRATGLCRGCEREGARREKYTVSIRGPKGESWSCDVGEAKWRSLGNGVEVQVKVAVMGGGVRCESL
jgi:Zn-finger nucleic acid-binding protein